MSNSKNDKFEYQIFSKTLSKEECERLIAISSNYKTGRTVEGELDRDTNYRKASVASFDSEPSEITKLRKIFSDITKTNLSQQETPVSVIKYVEGGSIIPHRDYFGGVDNLTHPEAGDRLITGIAYLNDDYEGGETLFTIENIKVKGKQGDLLVWYNLNKDGTPNRNTIHAGQPVTKGTKYIVILWARERDINTHILKTLF